MNNAQMKSMPLDNYIEWMLTNERYSVNVDSGDVSGPKGPVKTFPNSRGYPSVNLVFNRLVVRRALVHRMIAVRVWGVDAISGKQVGHIDGNTSRSVASNLWLPNTAAEHVYFDGTHKNLCPRKPKSHWLPCVRCSDPDGRADTGKTPDRITGARFGIDGAICRRCYRTLQERERRCHGDVVKEVIERRLGVSE